MTWQFLCLFRSSTQTLDIQILPEKVLLICFGGPNIFSGGVWMSKTKSNGESPRVVLFLRFLWYKPPIFLFFPCCIRPFFFGTPSFFFKTTQFLSFLMLNLNLFKLNQRLKPTTSILFFPQQILSFPTNQKFQVLYLFWFLNGQHDLAKKHQKKHPTRYRETARFFSG